jgi:hypothetical protein
MDPQFHEEIKAVLSLLDQDRRDRRQNDIPGRTSIVQLLAANMLSEDVNLFWLHRLQQSLEARSLFFGLLACFLAAGPLFHCSS